MRYNISPVHVLYIHLISRFEKSLIVILIGEGDFLCINMELWMHNNSVDSTVPNLF